MATKPHISYQLQVSKLKDNGFIIRDKNHAITFLMTANYYRLSGYLLPFKISNNQFISGIEFTRIINIYYFDMGLSTWLYQVIAEIELYLRTQFSYYLGEKYGSLGYMDSSNYKPSHKHSVFLLKVEDCKRSNSRTLVVQHHQSKYNDQFPIWVMIEFFSVGMISILYNDLKTMDQKNIARNSFNSGVNQVQSWLKCLTDMRNKQAHYTRFYYWNFNNIPKNEKHSKREMDRTLFSQIVVLKNLYPNKENWNKKMIPQLEKLMIESSSDIDLAHIGFPFNWQELLSCL